MTARRSSIEESLAKRGRPLMWANEQEAAVLCRVGSDDFRKKVKEWEKQGFPPKDPRNGMRPIPAIYAFFGLPQGHMSETYPLAPTPIDDEEDGKANWS